MPEIVLRHSDKSVLPYVTSIPLGVDPTEVEAAYPGWTLDTTKDAVVTARKEHDEGVAKAWAKFSEDTGSTPVAVATTALAKETK